MKLIELPVQTIQFYTTAQYPCSYLPDLQARSQVAVPSASINTNVYSELVREGFRRSGHFIYRPQCDHCEACQSLRVPTQTFTASRSQRRALKAHETLVTKIQTPRFVPEHYALYTQYQTAQHADSAMQQDGVMQYAQFLLASHVDTQLVEFRDPVTHALKIVSLIDVLSDGLSAVYTFYDTRDGASYGTYAILWLIEQAKKKGLPFAYLGYWIGGTRKMRYKERFGPHQKLSPDPLHPQTASWQ